MNHHHTYPVAAGYKAEGASKIAAGRIDARGERKQGLLIEAVILICLDANGMTADEIAAAQNESVLSTRPRCSELVSLGILHKSSEHRLSHELKTPAHVLAPGTALLDLLERELPETEEHLRIVVRALIVSKLAEARALKRLLKHGPAQD